MDREIGGGVYPGTIVLLAAPPASQDGELLHATMRERRTRNVTSLVELKDARFATGSVGVLHAAVSENRSPLRDGTTSFVDIVLDVEVERNGSRVDQLLSVP